METVIERIAHKHFWKFHGGIHPPQQKFLTTDKPIRALTIPDELILPLQQHIGVAGDLLVKVGDTVLKGQALTGSDNPMALAIHAPTSGTVTAIKNSVIAHPSGLSELCLFLKPDGKDQWRARTICPDFSQLSKNDLIGKIASAGISGMGGAGFPSHIKVSTPAKIDFLIINAAECEPYITSDDLLMREQSASVVDGINILEQIIQPSHILIAIEDNKPEAIAALQQATQALDNIQVCVLPTKYPTGGEKQLIKILTGQEVPSGVLPSSLGIVMHNVATCFAIADAVINDIPLIKRVVTVSGQALDKPQNVWTLLGTPVSYLLKQCGYHNKNKKHIIMGGPMMGFSLPSDNVPVVKTSNCILAPSEKEIASPYATGDKEAECIRCGQCAEVCPSQLLPQELQWHAKAKEQQQLMALNLFDCIECGACAYVCPSQIPLVHYYRVAKSEIRQQKLLDSKAEKAKIRFEARKARLERDKKAREEKHKKAAEARKARMNSGTAEAKTEVSAVAAALARVKAKKALAAGNTETAASNAAPESLAASEGLAAEKSAQKSQVAAAIARAKAKKLAAQQASSEPSTTASAATENVEVKVANDSVNNAPSNNADSEENHKAAPLDKKAKVAAAVAKAKAKALAKAQAKKLAEQSTVADKEQTPAANNEQSPPAAEPSVVDKKAKIAAAVAKAKAKALAKAQSKKLAADAANEKNKSESS